jgi:tagatose-1,6-bisphosphate aldolase non-catalytic subunit AgaZ/GatZ
VDNPRDYPKAGMGGANIGPEFTEAEYHALMELVKIEEDLFRNNLIAEKSNFAETLKNAVIKSGRWKKWLQDDEQDRDFNKLTRARQGWLVRTGCRYIWATSEVLAARAMLYKSCENNGIAAEERVLLEIERPMDKYFRTFNLINLNDRI